MRSNPIRAISFLGFGVLLALPLCVGANRAAAEAGSQKVTAANSVAAGALETDASLDVVLAYAQAHNPAIRAARQQWEAALQRSTQERSYENPMVTYAPDTGNMAQTRAGPQGNGVAITQSVPFPGKLTLRGKIADQEAQAKYQVLQAMTQEVSREVRRRYATYYLAARSLETNASITTLMQQFATIAQQKYEVGTAAQQDVIHAQEELSRLAVERVKFEGDQRSALGQLNALLDRPSRAAITVPPELHAGVPTRPLADLISLAGTARPELKSQDHIIRARQRALSLAKLGYLPDFKLGAQYTEVQGGTNPSFAEDGHDIWMAQIGLSIPIWINRIRAGVQEADAHLMAEQSRRRALVDRVDDQVQDAYERLGVAGKTDRIYRTTLIPQTQERVAAARAGYQTGVVDFLTLIDSLKSLEGVQLDEYRAVRDFQQAAADLGRAVGRPVASLIQPAAGAGR